jgi:hypothetical protein
VDRRDKQSCFLKLIKMTEQELLIDTIEYYSENTSRRCVSDKGCFYSPRECNENRMAWTPKGHKRKEYTGDGCAIGRLFKPEDRCKIDNFASEYCEDTSVEQVFQVEEILEFTPGWLQEMDMSFLVDLQCLHDTHSHWDSEGLTDEGHNFAERMYKTYSL